MKVSDLQVILLRLDELLQTAGGKRPGELAAFREGLEPFRDLTIKRFAAELRRLTDPDKADHPPALPRKSKAGKTSGLDVDEIAREVQTLYFRAAAPETTIDMIEETAKRLESLTKDALVKVAEGIELIGMDHKKKGSIVVAIKQRILSRKGASQKVSRIDRAV